MEKDIEEIVQCYDRFVDIVNNGKRYRRNSAML